MINYIVYEMIMIAILIIGPDPSTASFKMISTTGDVANISYVRNNIPDQIEGAHEYIVTISANGQKSKPVRYGFADNLLYKVSSDDIGENASFELDMMRFIQSIKMDKLKSLKQECKSMYQDKLIFQPGKNSLEIIAEKQKLIIQIDNNKIKK